MKKYVLLQGLELGNQFFSIASTDGYDDTKLLDGTVAYRIIGYAATVTEAQVKLYGRSYVPENYQEIE